MGYIDISASTPKKLKATLDARIHRAITRMTIDGDRIKIELADGSTINLGTIVTSVNDKTGAVRIDADDVGAVSNEAFDTFIEQLGTTLSGMVRSVNGKTGVVQLSAADVGAPTSVQFSGLNVKVNSNSSLIGEHTEAIGSMQDDINLLAGQDRALRSDLNELDRAAVKTVNGNPPDASGNVVVPGGGTGDHLQLTNRDAANQHPMSAIEGLQDELDSKWTQGPELVLEAAMDGEVASIMMIDEESADGGMYATLSRSRSSEVPQIELYGLENDSAVRIRGIADPVWVSDAANKAYVDEHSGGLTPEQEAKLDAAVTDVTVNGTSVVSDGAAKIPRAAVNILGVVKSGLGVAVDSQGTLQFKAPSQAMLTQRNVWYGVSCSMLDLAVKIAMCDGVGAAWTAEEQVAAQERLGIRSVEGVEF